MNEMTGTIAEGGSFTLEKIRVAWERIRATLTALLKPSQKALNENEEPPKKIVRATIGNPIGSPLKHEAIQELLGQLYDVSADALRLKTERLIYLVGARSMLTEQIWRIDIDSERKAALTIYGTALKIEDKVEKKVVPGNAAKKKDDDVDHERIVCFAFDLKFEILGIHRQKDCATWVCKELFNPDVPAEPAKIVDPGPKGEHIND